MGDATYTQVAVPVGGASTTSSTNKQGNSFCGGCCDMVSNKMMPMSLTFASDGGGRREGRTSRTRRMRSF
jgi:hypothetical protein|eukprot:scaffold687_cov288-Chaetoceros_neogracile.AAC.15